MRSSRRCCSSSDASCSSHTTALARPTGTMDPTYDGVYRLAGNGDSSHCTNAAHGQAHLYLGPTGKWYLNSAFSPQQDTCKAVSTHAINPVGARDSRGLFERRLLVFGSSTTGNPGGRALMVSENDEFCIKNEEFCIKNVEFCRDRSAHGNVSTMRLRLIRKFKYQHEEIPPQLGRFSNISGELSSRNGCE